MIKLIVSDLDGTLLCDHQVSEENKQTIKELKEAGFLFTVATGRHINSARRIVEELELDLPVICNNGAHIVNPLDFKTIESISMKRSTLDQILTYFIEEDLDYMLTTTEDIYLTFGMKKAVNDEAGDIPMTVLSKEEMIGHHQDIIIKLLVVEFDMVKLETLQKYINTFEDVSAVVSANGFLNIGHHRASKGNGLRHLADHLGISLDQILAIGDQENDLSMIEQAGIGVAMENGHQSLLDSANEITMKACDHGFTHAIRSFVLNKK
jgi:Cof subfamily protein (haloacid dehalogenase superfamily)